MAVVNEHGLWIKEELDKSLYIIHAEKFDKNELKSLTITETDKYFNNIRTIRAKLANINSKNWQLNEVSILEDDGKRYSHKSYVYNSSFMIKIISNLFSNLNSLNIYELLQTIK